MKTVREFFSNKDFLVGFFVLFAVVLVFVFAWLVGGFNLFQSQERFFVHYNFVGGVEVGSPVRVGGVKVGKVEAIDFERKEIDREMTTIKLTLRVKKEAVDSIRLDSKFFVNIAGIIGERYIEISPGSSTSAPMPPHPTVRGVDPPRIDQLLSQGYGVFGKVQEFIDENHEILSSFMKELNLLLKGKDRKKLISLVDNLNGLTLELKHLAQNAQDPKARELFDKLLDITRRAHQIDKQALKKFLQDEGVRAHIF